VKKKLRIKYEEIKETRITRSKNETMNPSSRPRGKKISTIHYQSYPHLYTTWGKEKGKSRKDISLSPLYFQCVFFIFFFLLILLRYVLEESKRKKNLKSPFYRIKPKKSFIRKKKKRIYFNQHLISVCYHLTSFWHNRSLKWWIKRNKEEKIQTHWVTLVISKQPNEQDWWKIIT
jgi:hypothetical protein